MKRVDRKKMKKEMEKMKKKIEILCLVALGIALGGVGVGAISIASKDVSYTNSSSSVTNVQGAIEELYNTINAYNKISIKNTLIAEHGLRYTGANPNNYVSFNGELWRIIGIFDGKIKIIRNESIGNMKWNSTTNNDWKSSSLYSYLNTTYYNGINATYRNMIENATWRTGGWSTANITTAQMYGYEGSTKGASSTSLTATGYIGLMSASDFGYVSSGCYGGSQTLFNYDDSTCTSTNWLKGLNEWTITPNSVAAYNAFNANINGSINGGNHVANELAIRPSLYLKSNVYITGGVGTSSNPYTLGE